MASKNSSGVSYGKGRTRNYATVVYPESAPDNWLSTIQEAKIPIFISPLHDKDVNPTNEPKKPHYHVVTMFDTVKTKEQAEALFQTFGGVGCESVSSVRAYARYLCHLDNPEKAQYNISDVQQFGGADYRFIIGTVSDKRKALKEMREFIYNNDCTCYADLVDFADEHNDEWFDCLINGGAYFIKEYIKSYTWKHHHQEEK